MVLVEVLRVWVKISKILVNIFIVLVKLWLFDFYVLWLFLYVCGVVGGEGCGSRG